MRIFDISRTLDPWTLTWPGDEPVGFRSAARIKHDGYATTTITLSSHTGTHIDAPGHIYSGDSVPGLCDIALEVLCGPARVIELPAPVKAITADLLKEFDLNGAQRLLLKTGNSMLSDSEFCRDYAYLTADGAKYLLELGVLLVGIDYLSIESFLPEETGGDSVHNLLLDPKSPVVILESLDLRHVAPGDYTLFCLPIKLALSDGAPVRAVLVAA
ncbi:MAG: cyclase family protein [Myxococcota bacterium]